ncbi:MAG: hypothetical protein Q8P40_08565 [Nitrospirota bacterium]|nr:hypothetical protein [Nitrospirota bacterium]
MTDSATTITEIVSGTIEKLTDNYIAIAVITTCLYMAVMQITAPEWLIMMAGFVIKYYFDKKNGNGNEGAK